MGYRINTLRIEEVRSVRRQLGWILAALVSVCVLLTGSFVRSLIPNDAPEPTPLIVLQLAQPSFDPGTKLELKCFRARDAFIESSWNECEKSGSEAATDSCIWKLTDFRLVSEGGQPKPSLTQADIDGATSVYVLGTHDSVRVLPGRTLDSNFELASKRAVEVTRSLKLAPAVPIPLAELPQTCLTNDERSRPSPPQLRRMPAVLVLSHQKES